VVVFLITVGSLVTGTLLAWMAATALPMWQPWAWTPDRSRAWRTDDWRSTVTPRWRISARAARLHAGGRPRPPAARRPASSRRRAGRPL
jgi:hypothetical protein